MSGVIWITGLPGTGKTTLARAIANRVGRKKTQILDGDAVRRTISLDLGFTEYGRKEHGRRMAHLAAMFANAEILTIVAMVSPYSETRRLAERLVPNWHEVLLSAPLKIIMKRRPNFYAIPYELYGCPARYDTSQKGWSPGKIAEDVLEELAWRI